MSNFLDFMEENPKIYFYEKSIKQILKHIKKHYKLKVDDLDAMSLFEIHTIDINNIEKKLEFVLKINYGVEKSINFNLYSFMLNDKLHFLSAYVDQTDDDFDLYNFCSAWRIRDNDDEETEKEINDALMDEFNTYYQ